MILLTAIVGGGSRNQHSRAEQSTPSSALEQSSRQRIIEAPMDGRNHG